MARQTDVAVIGGGIIGLTSAYFLAKAGLAVEVLDRSDLGREASWAGAGILPPGDPDRAATPADMLRAIGSARFAALSAELRELTGVDNGYRPCEGIEFLHPDDEYVLPLWDREGIAFERLTVDAVRRLEPAVGDVPGKAFHLPGCAQVRNPWHLRALIAACELAGVRLRPGEPVRQLGRAGITLESGERVEAGWYLLAAGAWSERLLAAFGVRPGVHPVRGQIVLLNPGRPVIRRVLMLGKEYLVPRDDGRVLVGSTEEPEAGFEKANTADAVSRLRTLAVQTVPALAKSAVEKCWAGLRPGSPDGQPFIGPIPGAENVFVAAGHFRAGVQLSIGTARLVTDLLIGRPPCVPPEAFRPDREPTAGAKPAFRS
jgi:glycine oxidase